MQHYRPPLVAAAILLAGLAGFVDAVAFASIGFFASFMSGNSTRLAVDMVAGAADAALLAATLLGSFVGGVVAASLLAAAAGRRRKSAVMALVTLLLAAGTLLATGGGGPGWAAAALLAAAMGAENGVFERDGEVAIGLTYMTGSLVRMGQRLAGALTGRQPPFAWVPYALLWLGFMAGALAGAAGFLRHGAAILWAAVAVAAALTLILLRVAAPYEPPSR